ncbi:DNA repair protein RecN (Recombination protein N) [Naumannella cuiyingiana]|uniref:DNA repair protein RecN n=1 Tax=Naumannella cuiyingiana TaxID=1347891 RepID=A0A7Z0DBD3_9ACTN|nr:DNA repair protein RecN [Naumannella cuiyingiana]NYI72416.1 DNA repair protein RecN (Recombination protein N) [Naumannella cuiyingiana]
MITEVRIRNLGVISDAVLEPDAGLTVLTGETGAGKTMIVSSLGLLLAQRADPATVRTGTDRALVEGRFDADRLPSALSEAVAEAGGELEDGELLIARQVGATGRSRAFVGGAQTNLDRLGSLAAELITIHGQSGQLELARADRQRDILDSYAGPELLELRAAYHELFSTQRAELDELAALRADAQARAREIDLLRFGIAEIDQVAPEAGEDDRLAEEANRLTDVDELRVAARTAGEALAGADDEPGTGAQSALAATAAAARQLADRDGAAAGIADTAAELLVAAQDLGGELSRYESTLEADPQRLAAVMDRRAALAGLTRKYGSDIDAVLAWRTSSAAELERLAGSDDRIDELAARTESRARELAERATRLTEHRRAAADRIASTVGAELAALAMPHARLAFTVEPAVEAGPWGADRIELVFSANAGMAPQPLVKAASGGELSRVRLALEAVLGDAGAATGGTVVFDEVDAGVGGQVGLEIGKRLAAMARGHQVIVVTHLAQVAAYADRHFVIEKSSDGQVTTSGLTEVTGKAREAELARMMAGLAETGSARAHARELLAEAARAGK